jgi:choline dehydrogenase
VVVSGPGSSFDFVVVGGGSAGAVVARRLVDAGASVALVEAGAAPRDPNVDDPGGWPHLLQGELDWAYVTDPQPAAAGRRIPWPRGKVLGGTSALNGMAYIRGHRLDYDGWAYDGCDGWSWAEVLPVFKRSEDCDLGESETRGAGGPLRVTTRYEPHPLLAAFAAAAQAAGLPFNDDHNTGELDGVGLTQLTVRDGVRETTEAAFLRPVLDAPTLTVFTNALARRLLFARGRCTGVEIDAEGELLDLEASAEVILSAGTIGSPQLLLLSGIGPADELRPLGIRALVDLPGVGKNLQDHLIAPLTYTSARPIPPRRPRLSQHHVHLFWRSRPGLAVPDTQPVCFHIPLYREEWMHGPGEGAAFTVVGGLIRPASRGEIRLTAPEPEAPLVLDPRYLTCDADLEALTRSVELCREIVRREPLARWAAEELYPGPQVRTDAELREYVRRTVGSYHHQVGTCRMGRGADAVVDPELRVHGVEGLRVADVSIMPAITTGNTYAPAIMIGERAADFALAAAGNSLRAAELVR